MKIYLVCTIVAFALSLLFCLTLIPILKKLKNGQNILVYVKEHQGKSGTPTMGGIAFIFAAVLSCVLCVRKADKTLILSLAIGLSYMLVGMIDDVLKHKHKENKGLTAGQKFSFQALIALFVGIYCTREGLAKAYLPFVNQSVNFGWFYAVLVIFAYLAMVNAVNLTDGLDGLAAGTCVPFFIALACLILLQNGNVTLSVLSFCLVGAMLSYLIFNVHPARVFMGDTGSLALGGFATSIATFSGNILYLPIIGVCFVLSVISVLLQVIYYKATKGKRIFLMAPLHHHFQQKGYSETHIAYAYFVITLMMGIISMLTLL